MRRRLSCTVTVWHRGAVSVGVMQARSLRLSQVRRCLLRGLPQIRMAAKYRLIGLVSRSVLGMRAMMATLSSLGQHPIRSQALRICASHSREAKPSLARALGEIASPLVPVPREKVRAARSKHMPVRGGKWSSRVTSISVEGPSPCPQMLPTCGLRATQQPGHKEHLVWGGRR